MGTDPKHKTEEAHDMKKWSVQLAKTIDDSPLPCGAWFTLTQKLNGVRGTFYQGKIVGRNGTAYTGLDHITKALQPFQDWVLDGELTLADPGELTDSESFRAAAGLVRRHDGDKQNLALTIFDAVPVAEFQNGASKAGYKQRRAWLDKFACQLAGVSCVRVLPALYQGTNASVIPVLLDKMVSEGKEGLIANLDTPYQCKRNSGILKIKKFYTMDLPILRCVRGTGSNADMLGAFIVGYDGLETGVGTGFTKQEREIFWRDRDRLVGTLCEVRYKEISCNKNGGKSLQFPTFVALRTDKREVSVPQCCARAMRDSGQLTFDFMSF